MSKELEIEILNPTGVLFLVFGLPGAATSENSEDLSEYDIGC